MKEYLVFDEDGIIGIVDPSLYDGFVNADWELEDLLGKFVDEMNEQHIIVWKAADFGGDWRIKVLTEKSKKKSFREFKTQIEVSSGELYFIDYTSLTAVAQFEEDSIAGKCLSENKILLENGCYNIQIRQMFDPEDYDFIEDSKDSCFEVIINKVESRAESQIDSVYWWED